MLDTIFNYVDMSIRPLVTYLYRVEFYRKGTAVDKLNQYVMQVESIDLPKLNVSTKELSFMSTKKIVSTRVNLSGETTMSFKLRRDSFVDYLSSMNYVKTKSSNMTYIGNKRPFDELRIYILNGNVVNDTEYDVQKACILYGCVVTDVSFDPLSYESESAIKCNMTIKYSSWNPA